MRKEVHKNTWIGGRPLQVAWTEGERIRQEDANWKENGKCELSCRVAGGAYDAAISTVYEDYTTLNGMVSGQSTLRPGYWSGYTTYNSMSTSEEEDDEREYLQE